MPGQDVRSIAVRCIRHVRACIHDHRQGDVRPVTAAPRVP